MEILSHVVDDLFYFTSPWVALNHDIRKVVKNPFLFPRQAIIYVFFFKA